MWNDTNPILHTTLANLYRERYQSLQRVPESRQEALKLREKLLEFLEQSDCYTPQTVLDLFPKDGELTPTDAFGGVSNLTATLLKPILSSVSLFLTLLTFSRWRS